MAATVRFPTRPLSIARSQTLLHDLTLWHCAVLSRGKWVVEISWQSSIFNQKGRSGQSLYNQQIGKQ